MPVPQLQDEDLGSLAFKVAISASGALACMILEFLFLIHDEVKFVWSALRTSWTARIYILTRYLGIVSQIYNVYFTVRMYQGVYTSPIGCRNWFAYQAISVQFFLFFTEGLVMHRVYSLFLRNPLILMTLVSFVVCQIASMGVSASLALPSNKHTTTCMMVTSNPGSAVFSATTMTTNIVLFLMTFWRYFRLPAKWVRQGLGRVVLRDSALSLIAITVVMLFLTLCSLDIIKLTMGGNITYYWLICVLWVSIGRIVVGHERIRKDEFQHEEGNTWSASTQLTSQIEMGQMSSSSDTHSESSVAHPVAPNTPQGPLSISIYEEGQRMGNQSEHLPTSPFTSDSWGTWIEDRSPYIGMHRYSPQPSRHSAEGANAATSDGNRDVTQTVVHPSILNDSPAAEFRVTA